MMKVPITRATAQQRQAGDTPSEAMMLMALAHMRDIGRIPGHKADPRYVQAQPDADANGEAT